MRKVLQLTCFIAWASLWVVTRTSNAQDLKGLAISAEYVAAPLFKGVAHNEAVQLRIFVPEGEGVQFTQVNLQLDLQAVDAIESLTLFKCKPFERAFETSVAIGSAAPSREVAMPANLQAAPGLTYLWIAVTLKPGADPDSRPTLRVKGVVSEKGSIHAVGQDHPDGYSYRIGIALRKPGDDNVHTYRIPGLVTTGKGTLIAVYDIRHESARDLPGNVDVGMSRSTDGGRTWEPMKTIMDMGPPHENNGIGDPAILFDPKNKYPVGCSIVEQGQSFDRGV